MPESPALLRCVVCGSEPRPTEACETAFVRCNVRRFRDEQFAVWRCAGCGSLHARDPVALDEYYRDYPFLGSGQDAQREPAYELLLTRLEQAGITREQRILDYGCGSGGFVRFLRAHGFARAVGYDAYMEEYRDASVLHQPHDCVFSQDVLEHVEDPLALLQQFATWTAPGGTIVIGTPEAAAIDLGRAERFVHALHLPYHRHILSAAALRALAEKLGWELTHYYPTSHVNRAMPGHNPRFGQHYLRCYDDCIDSLTEPFDARSWKLYTPVSAFWFFFGYFFDRHTDVMFVFRTPARPDAQPSPQIGAEAASAPASD